MIMVRDEEVQMVLRLDLMTEILEEVRLVLKLGEETLLGLSGQHPGRRDLRRNRPQPGPVRGQ